MTREYRFQSNEQDARNIDIPKMLPEELKLLLKENEQKAIPAIAKNSEATNLLAYLTQKQDTSHILMLGDSREIGSIPDESVHLIVTSPPYWILKRYESNESQLGHVVDYEDFLDQLDKVWTHVLRVLVPGGRLVVVVGDVCLPRRVYGRHVVFPLHASIQERCRVLGFDNLTPIIWHKIANARLEASGNGGGFLGKPYEPNGVIKNDIEYILFQRKPGGYRKPDLRTRLLSVISESDHREWFQQIWTLGGASTREHPAPYPLTLAERLIRMYSFVGDTVLDPFMGTGTSNEAAAKWGRNSIGVEIEPTYFEMAQKRLDRIEEQHRQYSLMLE